MTVQIVVGSSGGLGKEVFERIMEFSFANWVDGWQLPEVDVAAPATILKRCEALHDDSVVGVINCVGVNELTEFDALNASDASRLFQVNAYAIVDIVQSLRITGKLRKGAAICNVISNAANMPMTHSLAYNASKAAQAMITRQMARELKDYCIFGVSPNKLAGTGMSKDIESAVLKLRGWSAEEAKRYQLAALPAGVETPPKACAAFIVHLMNPMHHPFITGCIFPYGGPQ